MSASDYGYATSGNSTTDRATCLSKELINWDSASDCYNNDYLFNDSYFQWTLAPYSSGSAVAFYVDRNGSVHNFAGVVQISVGVRPAAFLKSNISITDVGTGTAESPYQLKVG